jgi:hypothetical protein
MAQCQGKTKRGDRCRRDARQESNFCAIHQEQEIRARTFPKTEWDRDSIAKAAIGFALVGAIFFFRLRK